MTSLSCCLLEKIPQSSSNTPALLCRLEIAVVLQMSSPIRRGRQRPSFEKLSGISAFYPSRSFCSAVPVRADAADSQGQRRRTRTPEVVPCFETQELVGVAPREEVHAVADVGPASPALHDASGGRLELPASLDSQPRPSAKVSLPSPNRVPFFFGTESEAVLRSKSGVHLKGDWIGSIFKD